jgi:hypothetical protein
MGYFWVGFLAGYCVFALVLLRPKWRKERIRQRLRNRRSGAPTNLNAHWHSTRPLLPFYAIWFLLLALLAIAITHALSSFAVDDAPITDSLIRLAARALIPWLLGFLVGSIGLSVLRRLTFRRGTAATIASLGAFASLGIFAILIAKDPDLSFLRAASIGGVSFDFSSANSVPFEREVRDFTLASTDPSRSGQPLTRIRYGLDLLADWSNFALRDREYAKALGAPSPRLVTETQRIEEFFGKNVIAPTAAALGRIHERRQSQDIWWITDRSILETLQVLIATSKRGHHADHMRAYAKLRASIADMWIKACTYRWAVLSIPPCVDEDKAIIGALDQLHEAISSSTANFLFDTQRSYATLLIAITQHMSGDSAAAIAQIHDILTAGSALAGRQEAALSRELRADRFIAMFDDFRVSSIYINFLFGTFAADEHPTYVGVRWLRAQLASLEIARAILVESELLNVWNEALKLGADEVVLASCPQKLRDTPLARRFLLAYSSTLNNIVLAGAHDLNHVRSINMSGTIQQVSKQVRDVPLACLVNASPNRDVATVAASVRYAFDNTLALHELSIAREETMGLERRKSAACRAKRFADRALRHLTRSSDPAVSFAMQKLDHERIVAFSRESATRAALLLKTASNLKTQLGVSGSCN